MMTRTPASCSGPFASYCRLKIAIGAMVVVLVSAIAATLYFASSH